MRVIVNFKIENVIMHLSYNILSASSRPKRRAAPRQLRLRLRARARVAPHPNRRSQVRHRCLALHLVAQLVFAIISHRVNETALHETAAAEIGALRTAHVRISGPKFLNIIEWNIL